MIRSCCPNACREAMERKRSRDERTGGPGSEREPPRTHAQNPPEAQQPDATIDEIQEWPSIATHTPPVEPMPPRMAAMRTEGAMQEHLRQPQAEAGLEKETPSKRRRGRPRSIVFDYFKREQEEDGTFVNRCIFCNFKSKDKSQNPTYLARHCLTSCQAPPEVIERLQQARSSASHGSRQPPSTSAPESQPLTFPYNPATDQHRGAPLSTRMDVFSDKGSAFDARSTALPSLQANLPFQSIPESSSQGRSIRRDEARGRAPMMLPMPAPSIMLSDPFPIQTSSDAMVRQTLPSVGIARTAVPEAAGGQSRERANVSEGSGSGLQQSPQYQVSSAYMQGLTPALRDIEQQRAQHHIMRSSSPQIPPSTSFEGTTDLRTVRPPHRSLQPKADSPFAYAQQDTLEWSPRPWSAKSAAQTGHAVPRPIGVRTRPSQTVEVPRLASLPTLSDLRHSRLGADVDESAVGTPEQSQARLVQGMRETFEQPDSLRLKIDERLRLVQRCTAAVDLALSNAETCTLICLGDLQRQQFNRVRDGPAQLNDDELEGLGLGAGSYDGVCTAMAIDSRERIVFLGAEDCLLHAQVATFVGSCTGRHLSGGSFSAILFACDPRDAVVAAFSEIQSQYRNVFLVLDVAHAADELCLRMANESVSAAKCTRQTYAIARFMATNDLLLDVKSLETVNLLPESERFSSVVQAMLEIVSHKQTLMTALQRLQSVSDSTSTYNVAMSRFAATLSDLLNSESFIRSLYKTAKFLEPLSRLVFLYDGGSRTPARGFHNVERDCIEASRSLEQLPSREMQVTNHALLTRMASSCLLGEKTATVVVGTVAGNAALLATHLDPQYFPPPEGVTGSVREQRLYHALHVACNGSGLRVDETWAQMLRFLYHKETSFSNDALSAALTNIVTPLTWWARYGRAACPDLSQVALKILTIPASASKIPRQVAHSTAQDTRLRGAAMRRDPTKRDHVFCMWNARLSKMSDETLLTVGSPLDSPLSAAAGLFAQ